MTQAPSKTVAVPKAVQTQTANTSAAKPAIVQLQGVSKIYSNQAHGLADINLTLQQGDFLFVTGASGSGKSTLIKLIYGAERADQGQVIVENQNVSELRGDRLSLLRRRLGVVFQDYKLIPKRTVAENVAFVLRTQGVPRQEVQRRLIPTLKMVGLENKADCFPHQLSGGEQQRVSIARAVIGTPSILLADEPTGNLDTENALQVINILKKLNSFGITVMVTTHDIHLIKTCTFPVIKLNDGRLCSIQNFKEL